MNGKQTQETFTRDCKWCYTCESGVDKNVTREMLDARKKGVGGQRQRRKREEAKCKTCERCYSCEQGVDKEVTADTRRRNVPPEQRQRDCVKCYTCQSNVDKKINADNVTPEMKMRMQQQRQQQEKGTPATFFVFPTNGCNLRCTYCYANNKPGKMTRATMHQVVKFLFEIQPKKNVNVHFFGGEPMVMWDMMMDTVELGNQQAKKNEYQVGWGMTTNGTLLNSERLAWIKDHFKQNPFLLSIDGRPKTHDKNRVLAGGKPTHHLIPVDEIVKLFPNLECRPTICPDTAKDWFEDYKWLKNKGFKFIAIEPDFECEWSEEQKMDYEKMLRQLVKYYVYAHRANSPVRMKFIDQVISQLQSREEVPGGDMCGVAQNSVAIDHRGKLYACQRYASYNDPKTFAIGDVWAGFDEFRLLETQNLARRRVFGDASKGYNCAICEARRFCHKGCNAANKKWTGRRDIALPMYCELSKIEVRAALSALQDLDLLDYRRKNRPQGQAGQCGVQKECGANIC